MTGYAPLVKRLLDGELTLAELPPELQAEGAEALRLLGADRGPVALPAALEARVMGAGLAAAAALLLVVGGPGVTVSTRGPAATRAAGPDSVFVRFVLYAPGAKLVGLAGTFNQWDQSATPLVRAGSDGVWTVTVALPVGQHQYAFVVDGRRWVTDPAAPGVDDGFGRRNSVIAVGGSRGRVL